MLTVLPLIGVLVGGIPSLLLAFGLLAWWQAARGCWSCCSPLQTFEAVVVRPFVDARTVRVGPTVPIVVGLLAFELYGVGGSIYGIALAVIGMAALDSIGRLRGSSRRATTPRRYVTGNDHRSDCRSNASFGLCSIDSTAPWMRVTASTTPRGCCGVPLTRTSR